MYWSEKGNVLLNPEMSWQFQIPFPTIKSYIQGKWDKIKNILMLNKEFFHSQAYLTQIQQGKHASQDELSNTARSAFLVEKRRISAKAAATFSN